MTHEFHSTFPMFIFSKNLVKYFVILFFVLVLIYDPFELEYNLNLKGHHVPYARMSLCIIIIVASAFIQLVAA